MGLNSVLKQFSPISLKEMDSVELMNRFDSKFIFPLLSLNEVLKNLNKYYQVLNVKGKNVHSYESLYLDDEKNRFYNDHHSGKNPRFKVRHRKYLDSNMSFLEVKEKKNGRTNKNRISSTMWAEDFSDNQTKFLNDFSLPTKNLRKTIKTSYDRITLVSLLSSERITIDTNIQFSDKKSTVTTHEFVVAEIKQNKIQRDSPFYKRMRAMNLRRTNISKYIIGRILLDDKKSLKHNRFKSTLMKIQKIEK